MDEALRDLGDYVTAAHSGVEMEIASGELMLRVAPAGLLKLLAFLRDDQNCQFKQLIDITAVDYPERRPRFDVVYLLLSHKQNQRVRVKAGIDDGETVPSVCELYRAANWCEREVWDLYGIFFDRHPDLRRLLTDYGFEGHPLRKDFPLTGYVEVRYDEAQKRVVYEPVKLVQEFRSFDFESPWEGMLQQLPGDEKANGEGEESKV